MDFIIGETSASTGRSAETGRRETDSVAETGGLLLGGFAKVSTD